MIYVLFVLNLFMVALVISLFIYHIEIVNFTNEVQLHDNILTTEDHHMLEEILGNLTNGR